MQMPCYTEYIIFLSGIEAFYVAVHIDIAYYSTDWKIWKAGRPKGNMSGFMQEKTDAEIAAFSKAAFYGYRPAVMGRALPDHI